MTGTRPTVRLTAGQKTTPQACIWMQAGVVKQKCCTIDYACHTCRFDRVLRRIVDENRRLKHHSERQPSPGGEPRHTARRRLIHWSDALLALPPHRRPCVHYLKQRIAFRSCNNAYACGSCEFDQYFQDQFSVHTVLKPIAVQEIQGLKFPQGYYLHQGHTWVRMESDGEVRIGLDAFASQLLGNLDTVVLPLMGKTLVRGEGALGVGRETWRTDLPAPVSGVVTAANARVLERPDLVEEDPYGEGWLLMAYVDDLRRDIRQLLMGAEAKAHLEHDIEALHATIEAQLGPLTADGGRLVHGILGHLPRECWDAVADQFLLRK
jgi:glycine cleavage system H lipoate-binding protein